MAPTRWGIISCENISNDFCVGLHTLSPEEHKIQAVAARSLDSTKKFAQKFSVAKAYGSYDELVKDPEIDGLYVGSDNPTHLSLAKLALENGKPVLCEKPLCINMREVKDLIAYAQQRKLFLLEAIWSRFFPAYQRLKEEIQKETIGDVEQVKVTFGVPISEVDRVK